MNNYEIKEALRYGSQGLFYVMKMKDLTASLLRGDITIENFGVRASIITSECPVNWGSADMGASRLSSLLGSVEEEGLRIASLKPERKPGFMEPFWVDGHWKHSPMIGHDSEGKKIND